MKIVDFNKPINELCKEDPNIINIMKEVGFESITNPLMLKTAGRVMTINKGAKLRNINIADIKEIFIKYGYEIKE